jgi:DNA-binding response OmpR family regulator
MTGLDLAERLIRQKKSLKVIITSGYSPDKARTETLAASGITYLAKPFDTAVLARTVRACLDQESNHNPDR